MAIVRKGSDAGNGYKDLFKEVESVLSNNLTNLPSKEHARAVSVSVESFGELPGFDRELYANNFENVSVALESAATAAFRFAEQNDGKAQGTGGAYGFAVPHMAANMQKVAVEAAGVLMQGHNNVRAYYSEPDLSKFNAQDVVKHQQVTVGKHGAIPTIPGNAAPSMESFDEKVTDDWREHSYSIAMTAAKQHAFNELFYKTQILTPDNAGFILTIRRNVVWDGWTSTSLDGDQVKNTKRNIMEGLLDHEVLETETTDLIPVLRDENEKYFVSDSLLAPQKVSQNGEVFETNYLKFNVGGFNLIKLAQTPSRLSKGSPNHTDSLDSRIALDHLLISATKGSTVEAFDFNVNRSNFAQFLATREYNFRDTTVKFHHDDLDLSKDKQTIGQAPSAILKPITDAGYTLKLGLKIDGEMNVEFGNGNVRVAEVGVVAAFKEGKKIDLTDATLAPLLAGITFTAEGFTLESRLTNLNQLERGLLIDSDVMKHGFMIPTLSPLCIMKPALTEEEKVYPKMEALQNAYRLQLRNAGVTALLNRAETLEDFLGNDVAHPLESQTGLEGLGQYWVKPYFIRRTVDVLAELNSTNSAGRVEDIQGLFTGIIQETIYRTDLKTGYSSALEMAFPGSNPKPHVAIGTDKRLPTYLMTQGDDRTAGIGFNYTIASISDLRMVNKVIMTFTLPGENEIHPLDHGILGMIPEYIVNFAMIREQRIANEIRLTPRYRHFHFLPIMMVLDVVNLEEAIAQRTAYDVNSKTEVVNTVKTEEQGAGAGA